MGNTNVFGVLPVLAIIWAIVAVIIWFILKYAIFGRSLYVLGSGVEVAKLSGIKVRKMLELVSFMVSQVSCLQHVFRVLFQPVVKDTI